MSSTVGETIFWRTKSKGVAGGGPAFLINYLRTGTDQRVPEEATSADTVHSHGWLVMHFNFSFAMRSTSLLSHLHMHCCFPFDHIIIWISSSLIKFRFLVANGQPNIISARTTGGNISSHTRLENTCNNNLIFIFPLIV